MSSEKVNPLIEVIDLVKENEMVSFQLEFERVNESSIDFTVYQTTGWNTDNSIAERERYLSGTLKWDACCHIDFGEEGYLYLSGKGDFKNHCKVMEGIWNECRTRISGWDSDNDK